MARKRVTELFPFLIPLRTKQRTFCFYQQMNWDKNHYAKTIQTELYPHVLYSAHFPLINEESGHDIQYQKNKVFNLKLAAKTLHGLLILPDETFSFWQATRYADKETPYKEGLCLVNGKIIKKAGGGVCQLSNLLFWLFLHSPLTIVERHPHAVKDFPTPGFPLGVDSTVKEGWLDLKLRNDTQANYQIEITFDEENIYGVLRVNQKPDYYYEVASKNLSYYRHQQKQYEAVSVYQQKLAASDQQVLSESLLYRNISQLNYTLPADTPWQDGPPQ